MREVLGLSVTAGALHAVCVKHGVITWAAHSSYNDTAGLVEVIASLVGECARQPRTLRAVLCRDLVQLRTILPAPRVRPAAARSFVSLQATRLFRRNGAGLITDALPVKTHSGETALFAGAVADEVSQGVIEGCKQAGMDLEALGAAAEVLPWTVDAAVGEGELCFPGRGEFEMVSATAAGTWRSRMVRAATAEGVSWVRALAGLGDAAPDYAAAYGAATRRPRLELIPAHHRAAWRRDRRRRTARVFAAAAAVWLLTGAIYVSRLIHTVRTAQGEIVALSERVDSALALRRDIHAAAVAVSTMREAVDHRSRTVELLADLSVALGDSTFLVSLRASGDSVIRLAGYSKRAAETLVNLERTRSVERAEFETPITGEMLSSDAGGSWERFAIVARRRVAP